MSRRKHAFVFFPTGSAGNFVAKVISGVQICKKDIIIHSSGHAHLHGDEYPVDPWFHNVDHADWQDATRLLNTLSMDQWREQLGRQRITDTHVHYSHAGSTITKVSQLLIDPKIIVITIDSEEENLASALLGPYKFSLVIDNNSSVKFVEYWTANKTKFFRNLGLSESVVTDMVITNRFSEKYRDIIAWSEIFPNSTKINPVHYEDVPHIKLPFSIILRKDSVAFIKVIQQCFDHELTDPQKEYISRNLDIYHAAQIQDLMNDPIEYVRQLEVRAKKRLEELRAAELFYRKHIFVFFPSGASGNFIAKVISGVQSCQKDIIMHSSGNAHKPDANYPVSNWMKDPKFFDYWHDITNLVSSFTEEQWRLQLGNPGNKIVNPVHLSHTGSTITKVIEICPNAKILVITVDTTEEKLASELLASYKVILSTGATEDKYDMYWVEKTTNNLRSYGMDEKSIHEVINSRFDEKYRDIIAWSEVRENPSEIRSIHYENVPHIKLPFSVILRKDAAALINIIQQCFDHDLTDTQREYISRNLDNYHSAQIQGLMNDPIEYISQLEVRAKKKLEELRATNIVPPVKNEIGVFSKIKQWIKNTLP